MTDIVQTKQKPKGIKMNIKKKEKAGSFILNHETQTKLQNT